MVRIGGGLRLPEPMLLRSARLPTSGEYAFEPKWDGFRALVSRNGRLRAVSRRGWDMTPLLPELAGLPDGVAVDGELVAFGADGLPSFPRLCDRMLHGKQPVRLEDPNQVEPLLLRCRLGRVSLQRSGLCASRSTPWLHATGAGAGGVAAGELLGGGSCRPMSSRNGG
jgi:hypothetical protein